MRKPADFNRKHNRTYPELYTALLHIEWIYYISSPSTSSRENNKFRITKQKENEVRCGALNFASLGFRAKKKTTTVLSIKTTNDLMVFHVAIQNLYRRSPSSPVHIKTIRNAEVS